MLISTLFLAFHSSPAGEAKQAQPQSLTTSVWMTEASLPQARQEASVAALNGQVYVVGGSTVPDRVNDVLVYDPASHTWSSRAPYPGVTRDHIGIAAVNGYLYLLGGLTAWPAPSVSTLQRYDPSSNTWIDRAPLPLARGAMGVAALDGKIYAAGGLRDGVAVNDFAVYDPRIDGWQILPPLPTARDHLVGVALNGKFYAIGGRPGSSAICSPMTIVEVYDPVTNTWGTAASMSTARGGHAAGTLNGRIQVFGGEGGVNCGVIGSAEEYDPVRNAWSPLPPMPTPRHGTGGAMIGNSIYLPGGARANGDAPTAVHERFTQSEQAASNAFLEQGGQVVIEAEHYDGHISRGGKAWVLHTDHAGYLGSGAMVAEPDTGSLINRGYQATSPELQYQVQFTTPGTYYVWVRAWADDDNDNSVHVGLDGQAVASADRVSTNHYGGWVWFDSTMDGAAAMLVVTSAGLHTVNVWMREDGFRLDRLLLTTSSAEVPTGDGPPESPRIGGPSASLLQSPYSGVPLVVPGTIQAEDFDNGGEGVAYHDSDGGNTGGQYRATDVDIEVCGDTGGGYNVGWVKAGEWLEYTVNVTATGTYTIEARVASNGGGGTFHVESDGDNKTGSMSIPNTGGWQSYQTISKSGVGLTQGQHTLRIAMDSDGATGFVGNFNYLSVVTPVPGSQGSPCAPPKILVFSKTAGFRHDSIPDGIAAIKRLGAENNFAVEATEDAAVFTDANLSQYQAIVFLSTTGTILDDRQKAAFRRYIEAGGGFVGIHSASDTEHDWPWYGGLVGAYFQSHPGIQKAAIRVEDRSHPSTASLPGRWERTDEWYNFALNPRGRVQVLATLDEATYSGGTMGADHPIAWYQAYDGGRAWYTGGGHTKESYAEPLFLQHLLGGIQFASGVKAARCLGSSGLGVSVESPTGRALANGSMATAFFGRLPVRPVRR